MASSLRTAAHLLDDAAQPVKHCLTMTEDLNAMAVFAAVAGGYDAGIQLGGVIDRDMIAVPVTGDIRMTVVGAPDYFARHPKPQHPRHLVEHDCLNRHPAAGSPPER